MNTHKKCIAFVVLSALVLMVGCASKPSNDKTGGGRYSIKHDHGPDKHVDLSHVPDAVPRVEPKSRGGNKSTYTVWGKRYYVMDSSAGYRERGTASWYGKKFHGHKTSNGEIYDMYAMSAAHKSLPLPTYVKVTNLDNGRSVVVRVNDRGPFHGSRLIDMSYAAAYKLDMLRTGTARVEVEAIIPGQPAIVKQAAAAATATKAEQEPKTEEPKTEEPIASGKYLQVGAYSSWTSAQTVKTQLQNVLPDLKAVINKRQGTNPIYRVQIGPVDHLETLNGVHRVLENAGYGKGHLVDLP